jgi:biotin synthase
MPPRRAPPDPRQPTLRSRRRTTEYEAHYRGRSPRIAGGREIHLGSLQPLGLYAANSMFVGDYLTTKGQLPEADYRMIEEMGFVITRGSEAAEPPAMPG